MTEEMQELGRRAVAASGWRWMDGMVAASPDWPDRGWRLCWADQMWDADGETPDGEWEAGGYNTVNGKVWGIANDGGEPMGLEGYIPDFSDPATLGCLLALVREAWGCQVHLRRWANPAPDMSGKDRSKWEPVDGMGRRLIPGPRVLFADEAEALVEALEAAGGGQ